MAEREEGKIDGPEHRSPRGFDGRIGGRGCGGRARRSQQPRHEEDPTEESSKSHVAHSRIAWASSHASAPRVKLVLALAGAALASGIVACSGRIGGLGQPEPAVSRAAAPPRFAAPGPPLAELPKPSPTPALAPPSPSAPAAQPEPTPTPSPVPLAEVSPPAPTPLPPAITFTIPLEEGWDPRRLDERPEVAEILEAARRHPQSRIYVTAYALEADARARGTDVRTVSDEIVVAVGRYLATRGIAPERITGRGLGAHPTIGRAAVVSLDVVAPEPALVSPRERAEREAARVAPERFPTENTAFKEVAGSPAYRIGRGDLLSITIWYSAGPQEHRVRVSPTGTVTFDLVEEAPVAGLTLQEARSLLANLLRRYVRNPRLDVAVAEHAARSVTIVGPGGPQAVTLSGRTTVLDLLAREKAVPPTADLKRIRVVRGNQEYSVNLFRAILDRDWKENMVLDDGDVIYLPTFTEAGSYVAVLGAVKNPGLYPIQNRLSAVEALYAAGGTLPGAYLPHARIVRGDRDRPQLLPADVDLVLEKGRLDANRELLPGDVLYVPSTRIANWNRFLADIRPTVELATLPLRGVGAALLFGRGGREVTSTTNVIIFPTPGVPLP
jgi:polysaccharide export outer membrane protein